MNNYFKIDFNDNVLAICTNRLDGHSTKPYDSFNLGYHVLDNKEDVDKNRDILANIMNTKQVVFPNQTHSSNIIQVKDMNCNVSDCDALYTKEKDIAVGVLTADCLPILFYCPDKEIVGTIHAGWQGSVKEITYKSFEYLIKHENIDISKTKVYLGPSISRDVYEVDHDVYSKVLSLDYTFLESCFKIKDNNKFNFDNVEFNLKQLEKIGIDYQNIQLSNICTYQNKDYFSYRQDNITGRQASIIKLIK